MGQFIALPILLVLRGLYYYFLHPSKPEREHESQLSFQQEIGGPGLPLGLPSAHSNPHQGLTRPSTATGFTGQQESADSLLSVLVHQRVSYINIPIDNL